MEKSSARLRDYLKLNVIIHFLNKCIQQIPGPCVYEAVWSRLLGEGERTLWFYRRYSIVRQGIFNPSRMNKIYCSRTKKKIGRKKPERERELSKNRSFRLFPFFVFRFCFPLSLSLSLSSLISNLFLFVFFPRCSLLTELLQKRI